jgi:hypothetical protein
MSEVLNLPVLTRDELLEANLEAVGNDYSAYCWHDTLKQVVHEGNKHPVTEAKLDGAGNFVCRILIGPNEIVFVALTQARLNSLVTVQVDMVVIEAMAEAAESPIN